MERRKGWKGSKVNALHEAAFAYPLPPFSPYSFLPSPSLPPTPVSRLRSRLVIAALAGVVIWVAFFDSHSIVRRAQYAAELGRLTEENVTMADDNAAVQARLDRGLDDATVEEVAREQYGMRRPGETVYRVRDDSGTDLWSVEPGDE